MLLVSKVPRALDAKTRLFGFELGDLLLIFLYLALTNLVFGSTRLKIPIVWMGTLALAATLYFVKRNRPEKFLEHWGEFHRTPGVLSASAPDIEYLPCNGITSFRSPMNPEARMTAEARPTLQFPEFQSEVALAHELPYWDFSDEGNGPGTCVLSDGSLIRGFRIRGVAIETWDSDRINEFTRGLRSFLSALPDGSDLQFWVRSQSDFSSVLSLHSEIQAASPTTQWLGDLRVSALRRLADEQALQHTEIVLFVYQRVQSTSKKITSFFSTPKRFVDFRRDEYLTRSAELTQTALAVSAHLQGLGLEMIPLTTSDFRRIAYETLNPERSRALGSPQVDRRHRDLEFGPGELAIEPRLAHASPREQLVLSDLIQGVEGFFLDEHYHRVISLKALPEFTYAALISRLLSVPFPFQLSLQIQVPDQSKELSSLQSKRRMAHSMSLSHSGRATDLESEAKLQSTEELLRELIQTGQKILYFQLGLVIRSKSRAELDLRTKGMLGKIRELNGAEGLAETVAGLKVFKTLLPAGNAALVRGRRIKTDNLADILPVYQAWEGNSKPVCLFQNRGGGLVAYDPFDPDLPNYNALVTGSSGSGKSFLNNCILLQGLAQRPLIYIIDIGGSYRKLCEWMGGQSIDLVPASAGGPPTPLNPFVLPPGQSEPSPQKVKFLLALLETMLGEGESDRLPKLDKSLLEQSILDTYRKAMPGVTPRLSDLRTILAGSTNSRLRDFAQMLYPWTGDRAYGRLLDAPGGMDLTSEFVVFDLKGLSSYPDLQAVSLLIITDFILGQVEGVPGRVKRILMDECWQLLKSRGASDFMEYCVRTLRKSGSGITFITQGLEEIEQSPIGAAILGNTASKFILVQRGDIDPVRKVLKLNDQEMALIGSLRQQKGSYSEAFLIANENRGVIRIAPTPQEYWLATSDAADHALLSAAQKRFPEMSFQDVILHLAKQFPLGSQGRRALDEPGGPQPQPKGDKS